MVIVPISWVVMRVKSLVPLATRFIQFQHLDNKDTYIWKVLRTQPEYSKATKVFTVITSNHPSEPLNVPQLDSISAASPHPAPMPIPPP